MFLVPIFYIFNLVCKLVADEGFDPKLHSHTTHFVLLKSGFVDEA